MGSRGSFLDSFSLREVCMNTTPVDTTPYFDTDPVMFGVLTICLGLIFVTSSRESGFWAKFYKVVPALLLAYLLPSIFASVGLIAPKWESVNAAGEVVKHKSQLYYVASRYLLPASLVLMTLSVDLKQIFNLGYKALVMFFTATAGIIIGGPVAVLLVSFVSPETVGGAGPDAVWRGLATLAGSWIGGGANQAAMLEIYGYNQALYGGMVLVDIVCANILMATLLLGIGRREAIDRWFQADNTAIEELKERVSSYSASIAKIATLTDLMLIVAVAFGAVGLSHLAADTISGWLTANVAAVADPTSALSSFGSHFFWLISTATLFGVVFSFTPLRKLEGAGASRLGSVCIYLLVATIGMKMDLGMIFENPGLIAVGLVWLVFHFLLLIVVAKLIRAPYFFLAVASQANVGGAASAPVVAAAFHPSLAAVGVLLAVLGYIVGTYGAMITAELMRLVSP